MKKTTPQKGEKTISEDWDERLPRGYSFHPREGQDEPAPTITQQAIIIILIVAPVIGYFFYEFFKH